MCEIMQKLQDEGRATGLAEGLAARRIEGRSEERTNTALKMLRFNEPIEKIINYTGLSEERIKELAQQLH